ncbi:MAG: hypothetical protein QM811_18805 [Pirellulales bacterium]
MPSLSEAWNTLFDAYVDPHEPYDDDADRWTSVGAAHDDVAGDDAHTDEQRLHALRRECRALAVENEFAINGHENRISYIVGPGHTYRAVVRRGQGAPPALLTAAQNEIDRFLAENRWSERQQEIVRRRDRDGEALLRFFVSPQGTLRVRFVEPGRVRTPLEYGQRPEARLGVLTLPEDVESVLGYFVDDRLVSAEEVQHRKANVDANVRRGVPLFAPVRKNLLRRSCCAT